MRPTITITALLALAAATTAAPDRTAALRQHAAPIWREYTRDRAARLAGRDQWLRVFFQHDPKAVRYTVRGDRGTVTAPGTVCVSAPCSSQAQAKRAPWKMQTRKVLTVTAIWKAGKWTPGPVEWSDPPR